MTAAPVEPPDWRRRDDCFRIAGLLVDPSRNVVATQSGEEALEPRIMDVLCFLAERAGTSLTRAQIIDAVWARSFGADESLTRAISRLRKIFGDTRTPAPVIETIPKRGYRLVAQVDGESDDDRPPESRTVIGSPSSGSRRFRGLRAIAALALAVGAVLIALMMWRQNVQPAGGSKPISVQLAPFDGANPDLKARGGLLSEQLAESLSRSSLFGVRRSGATAAPLPAEYSYVVHGNVQQAGSDRVRIFIDLADTATGVSIWSSAFERPRAPGADLPDDLARAMSAELDNHVLAAAKIAIRQKPATSLRPWELTLLATWVPGSDEVFLKPHGQDTFWPQLRALSLDPDYAPAHASLASAMAYQALFNPAADGAALRRQAREHAEKAQALAPYDAGVLYELATYDRLIGDRKAALDMLGRVLALQPGHPVAALDRTFVAAQCTNDSAIAIHQLEQSLAGLSSDNPVRWVVLSHIADLQLARGDLAAAVDAADRSRQIVHMTWSGITLAAASAASGNAAAASLASSETRREWPKLDWGWFDRSGVPVWCLHGNVQTHAASAFQALDFLTRTATIRR